VLSGHPVFCIAFICRDKPAKLGSKEARKSGQEIKWYPERIPVFCASQPPDFAIRWGCGLNPACRNEKWNAPISGGFSVS